jgi:biotin transport system substrate-specific component
MQSGASRKLMALVYTALMSALIAVSAMITIPLPSPVAITLQTFGVYFALFFLGGKAGTLSVLVYISLGAFGLPVFSGFSGGIGRLLDAGGGFIFGFLISSLAYWLLCALFGERMRLLCAFITLILLYTVGAVWYYAVFLGDGGFMAVLTATVFPFIIPDLVKILLADLLAKRLGGIIKRPE